MLKQKAANVYNIELSKTHICMYVDKKYIAWDTTFWRKKRASLLCCVEGSLDTISLQISKRKQGRQLFIYVIAIHLTLFTCFCCLIGQILVTISSCYHLLSLTFLPSLFSSSLSMINPITLPRKWFFSLKKWLSVLFFLQY